MPTSYLARFLPAPTFIRTLAAALVYLVFAGFAVAEDAPLKVTVYDVPTYGHVEADGSIDGLSVDLWRRAAESLGREYISSRSRRWRTSSRASSERIMTRQYALGRGEADAVVNSIGALQYLVSTRFKNTIRPPQGVLESAYMAIALPLGGALKKPIDEALVGITASQE